MVFDLRTLSIVSAFTNLLFALAMYALLRLVPTERHVRDWFASAGLLTLATLLIGLRGTIADLLSIILANTCLLLGIGYAWAASRGMLKRPRPVWAHWLGALLAVPPMLWFTYGEPSVAYRVAVVSLGVVPYLAAAAQEFWAHDRAQGTSPMRLAYRISVALFAAGVVIFLLRMGPAIQHKLAADFTSTTSGVVAAAYLYNIVFNVWLCILVALAVSFQLQNELRAARDRAETASRAKSRFLANMSHEVRTPMNGVLGMIQLLQASPLSPEQRDWLGAMRRSGESLLAVLNDILDYAKAESGHLRIEVHAFSPHALIDEMSRLFAPLAAAKGLRLVVTVAPAVPAAVHGDPQRLRQILVNLLTNAVKFTNEGELALRLAPAPEASGASVTWLRFEVADSGIGMSAETQAGIFEAFFQADGSATRRHGGTGLGLSIVHQLALLMGGKVAMESTLGVGSRFFVDLPLPVAAEPVVAHAEGGLPGAATVFDAARLLANLGGDYDLARVLAESLREDMTRDLQGLATAVGAADWAVAADLAGALRGLAGQAGGAALETRLAEVETQLRHGTAPPPGQLEALQAEWRALERALGEFVM